MDKIAKIYFYLIWFLYSCFIVSSYALADDNKNIPEWTQQHILAPQANLVFIVNIDKQMLVNDAIKIKPGVNDINYSKLSDDEIKIKISEQPYKAEPYIQLSRRLLRQNNYKQSDQVLNIALQRMLGELDKNSHQWHLVEEIMKIYQFAQENRKSKKLLQTFIADNPDNIDALLTLANLDILSGHFEKARINIDKAYRHKPERVEVYISEFLYQMYKGFLKLNDSVGHSEHVIMTVSTEFLEKAISDNPSIETPGMVLHALTVLQVFYTEIFENIDSFKHNRAFEFSVGEQWLDSLNQTKNYLQQRIGENKDTQYLDHFLLLMIAIIENKQNIAQEQFDVLVSNHISNNNVYRLMLFSYLSRQQMLKAVEVMEQSIKHNDNLEDRLILATLYHKVEKTSNSLTLIREYNGKQTLEAYIHQLAYALLGGEYEYAISLFEQLKDFNAIWKQQEFIYYAAIIALLKGEKEMASNYWNKLTKESDYYQNLENILQLSQ